MNLKAIVSPKRRAVSEVHNVKTQKTELIIITAVRTQILDVLMFL
jgi:hypothetical protein